MSPGRRPAGEAEKRAESDAQVAAAIQQQRTKTLESITFDEIKAAVLKLTDTQRAELVALLTRPRVGTN